MRIAHTLAAAFVLASATPAGAGGLSIYYGSGGHFDGHLGHAYGYPGPHLGYGHFFYYPPVFVAPPHFHDRHGFFPRFRDHDRRFLLPPGHGHGGEHFPLLRHRDRHFPPHRHGHFPRFEGRHSFGPLDRGHPSTVTPPPFQGRGFGGP